MKKLKSNQQKGQIILYKTSKNEVELKVKLEKETVWLTQNQMAELFNKSKSTINEHIKNIYKEKELILEETMRKFGNSEFSDKPTNYYNLDIIISVGYRVKSQNGVKFRIWATSILKQYLIQGYAINKNQIAKNYEVFLKAVEDVKKLLPAGGQVKAGDALELIKMFASTWLSLDAYDKDKFPKHGFTKKQVKIKSDNIIEALTRLKLELVKKKEAGELFGQEKEPGVVAGIVGNVYQAFAGREFYPTLEEKAAHLLYFMVKNHPFTDGNKRSGAFAFIWFLNQTGIFNARKLTPEALTALTLLIAESAPRDKDKMIGLVLMILGNRI